MKKMSLLSLGLLLALTACEEPAPAGWNANIDVNCKPQDPFDKTFAALSPKKFWREQEYDLGTLKAAGEKNLEMSQSVLDTSRAQKGDYFQRADQAANELGLRGKEKRDHVKKNMDRFEAEVKAIEDRLEKQKIANDWVRKCEQAVVRELRSLGLSPVPYDPEKRPM
ncbi:hypothetical protein [Terasakiella pusilla]|uniref:hypothetical protein n=1 Tax=Terasakiella pusilla TaxID=64973 RepID=UPI000490BE86|nr:hypothetical protein [Terasakiella pusilla]